MQAEIVQWEKSVKAKCIFDINVIRHQKGLFFKFSLRLDFDRETTLTSSDIKRVSLLNFL